MKNNQFIVKSSYIYGIVGIIAILLLVLVIPLEVQRGEPRLFPNLYTAGLLIVSVIKLIGLLLNKRTENFKFNNKVFKYVGLNIIIYMAYIFLIQYIGFFTMSILFIIALMRVLGEDWKITIILCVVLPGSIYLLFTQILALYFPSGIFF